MLRAAPAVLLLLLLAPLGAGLAATLLPAFGYLPVLGGSALGLAPWRALFAAPGFGHSVALTLWTGLSATAISLVLAVALAVVSRRSRIGRLVQAAIAPLLATPHAALAIGLAFLLAPSGWIARLISPWLTGWTRPPDIATVQDQLGLALIAGLVLKETPYLVLMAMAALGQAQAVPSLRQAASLGYGPWRAWLLAVLPRVWPQLRLPLMAVLAFSLSAVDVAIILGPSDPPPLAVLVLRWYRSPDLGLWFPASAGAVLLCGVTMVAIGAVLVLERLAGVVGRRWTRTGRRGGQGRLADAGATIAGGLLFGIGILAIVVLALWSFAAAWRFPAILPPAWSLAVWRTRADLLLAPAVATLSVGVVSTVIAIIVVIACLENERRLGHPPRRAMVVLYVPLVVPQIAFLFGLQTVLVRLRLDATWAGLALAHLLFVTPYVFLSLADPWRSVDPRYARTASCLGAPPWRVFRSVTLPLLARPLLAAAAVGFAVSVGLYLPTLFAGGGRVETLATQAVALAGGGDRRLTAATALLQAALPLAAYAIAALAPEWRLRRRLRPA